jgi:hypothetical protein
MKIRYGFVSNSSSSSFLVASNKEANDIEMTITLKVKMSDLLETTINNKEELMRYYSEDIGYESEEDILKDAFMVYDYKASLRALKEGKKIHVIIISSDGGPLEAAIYESDERKLPESPDYEVISK